MQATRVILWREFFSRYRFLFEGERYVVTIFNAGEMLPPAVMGTVTRRDNGRVVAVIYDRIGRASAYVARPVAERRNKRPKRAARPGADDPSDPALDVPAHLGLGNANRYIRGASQREFKRAANRRHRRGVKIALNTGDLRAVPDPMSDRDIF